MFYFYFFLNSDLVSPQCRHELVSTIRDAAQDYRANAIILQECSKSIGIYITKNLQKSVWLSQLNN